MLFLTEHGITSGRAVRIYRTYGHEAIATIKGMAVEDVGDIVTQNARRLFNLP